MKMASRSTDLISKTKQFCTCGTLFFSNLQKNKFARAARFFIFLCRCFSRLQCRFVLLKRQSSWLHIIFMEELSYVLTKDFFPVLMFAFSFLLSLIFTLLAASNSHFLTAPSLWDFHVFLPKKFVSFIFNLSLYLFLLYPRECKRKK